MEYTRYKEWGKDLFYFNHFANMARHNAFLIINDILNTVYKAEDQLTEESLSNLYKKVLAKSKGRPDELALLSSLLKKHFPFLHYYDNIQSDEIAPYLNSIKDLNIDSNKPEEVPEDDDPGMCIWWLSYVFLPILNRLRNETAHYGHTKLGGDIPFLEQSFNETIKEAQKRMNYSHEDVEHLLRTDSYYKPLSINKSLSEKGIFYLFCLFLDKKNGYQFLSHIKGFKDRRETAKKATTEVFTHNHCRLPYPKLDSSDLALDILNELNRCPGALYSVLSDDDRKKFITTLPTAEEGDEVMESVMKRGKEDRFPYFALRYLEQEGVLPGISFQLFLGRFEQKEAHHKIVGQEMREHKLLKNIHTFGQLERFKTEAANNFFLNEKKGMVEFYAPAYRMVGNRIGLILKDANINDTGFEEVLDNYKLPLEERNCPDAIMSTHELAALFFYNYLHREGIIGTSPKEHILSFLQNFKRFREDLKKGKLKPIPGEQKLYKMKCHKQGSSNELNRKRILLQEILNEYGLKVAWLPDACREYLLGYTSSDNTHIIKQEFLKMLNSSKSRRDKIIAFNKSISEHKRNNEIKLTQAKLEIRTGELATQLARDIIYMTSPMNKEGKSKKMNDLEYNVLQSMLAYFPLHKNELAAYLGILKEGKVWKHPFLENVLKELHSAQSLTKFYSLYYDAKIDWINDNIIKEEVAHDNNKKKYSWTLHAGAEKMVTEQYAHLLNLEKKTKTAPQKEYSDKAVFLPTGLFDEAISKSLIDKGYKLRENSNTAGCLKMYLNNETQPMYTDLKRYYRYVTGRGSRLTERMMEREKAKGFLSHNFANGSLRPMKEESLKQFGKKIKEKEAEILRQQSNDRALFLMLYAMPDANGVNRIVKEKAGLCKLGFDLNDNLLNTEYTVKQTLVRMVNNVRVERVVTATLPVKRYGEMRRFLKDRRLDGLLLYYPEGKEIPLGTLESSKTALKGEKYSYSNLIDELDVYDRKRNELMESIYEVDRLMAVNFPLIKKKTKGNVSYYEHYDCLDYAKTNLGLANEVSLLQKERITLLRSKLAHNQIPYEAWICEEIEKMDDPLITSRIINLVASCYDELLLSIKKKIKG